MTPSSDKKTSRRGFIKWASALTVVGAVGVVVGSVADRPQGEKTVTDTINQTSTSTMTQTETATETQVVTTTQPETLTSTQTQTVTRTQTQTITSTRAETLTSVQTETQTLINTQTQTLTDVQTTTETVATTPTSAFSIFWITDTQFLSETNPGLFNKLTNWIVNNWSSYNAKLVIHTGDLVQHGDIQAEWENADAAMSILSKNGIPYTWCAGNHDDFSNGDPTSGWRGNTWTSAFDPTVASAQMNAPGHANWVSDYHYGMNTAVSFSANGLNFLVVNIEWNAQPDVLNWVEGLLDNPTYADYRVIIAPHAYMDYNGNLDDEKWGPILATFVSGLTTLMDAHSSNVFLTLNGHFTTECGYNTVSPINGRNQLMFDRQDCADATDDPNGRGVDTVDTTYLDDSERVGGATVTILTFDAVGNQVNVTTYDVNTGKWRDDQYEKYSFTMFAAPLLDNALSKRLEMPATQK